MSHHVIDTVQWARRFKTVALRHSDAFKDRGGRERRRGTIDSTVFPLTKQRKEKDKMGTNESVKDGIRSARRNLSEAAGLLKKQSLIKLIVWLLEIRISLRKSMCILLTSPLHIVITVHDLC